MFVSTHPVRGGLYGCQGIQINGRELQSFSLQLLIHLLHSNELRFPFESISPVLYESKHSFSNYCGRIILSAEEKQNIKKDSLL